MIPACSHTGVPLHFHSSTTSGSASLTRARSRLSISPRQSPSSSILASIKSDGDPLLFMTLLAALNHAFEQETSSANARDHALIDYRASTNSCASDASCPGGHRLRAMTGTLAGAGEAIVEGAPSLDLGMGRLHADRFGQRQ